MCSLMMIDRSKHVGFFKCFNVCFRIIQYILVHLLVLIISECHVHVLKCLPDDGYLLPKHVATLHY
jgi:hypothetical protein